MAPSARPRRLGAVASVVLAGLASGGEGKAHENRLKLDMGLFDAHLACVDDCLRALPEKPGAKREDCMALADVQLKRCDEAFGEELDACMTRCEAAQRSGEGPSAKEEKDLLPQVRSYRQDVVHCFDKEGLRPQSVQTLEYPLKRCGLVHLVRVLPVALMDHTEEHIRRFLAARESVHMYHPGGLESPDDLDSEEEGSEIHIHELPLNLLGGRFEMVPPAEGTILGLVSWMTSHFNTPSHITSVWGHDHRDQAELAYVVIRGQHNVTAQVTDQPWHQDRDTNEDVRVQTAVHAWKSSSGPLEFLPASHRLHRRLRPNATVYPRGRRIDTAEKGDVLIYFSRLRHRGTRRTQKKPRVTLDMVLHSVNRVHHEESERKLEHVNTKFCRNSEYSPAREALDKFKELWAVKAEANRNSRE